ncbi:hypothetical protein AB0C02_21075 [Micromonospora sp. NPDC048999]|uniref:hypothetical protein n=1 Tax=Micromonospora sp. NPDC048999 TaxID=3155391 RepID=UPI0033CF346A
MERKVITGYDTVFITGAPVDAGVRAMLDGLSRNWPEMLVALGGSTLGPFAPWSSMRDLVPAGRGEVYVVRDPVMKERWDDVGYSLMDGGEGPFAVLYRPSPQPAIEVQLHEDPYDFGLGIGFEPYSATLVTAGLSLVTVVAPDDESPFSRGLLDSLRQALISKASTVPPALTT